MRHLVAILALCCSTHAVAESLAVIQTLEGFEARLRSSAAFQGSHSANGVWRAPDAALAQALPGAALFAGTSLSSIDEVVDIGRSRSYDQVALSAGVRIPLLGSRARYREELDESALNDTVREAERELRRREALTVVRQAYLDYWSARERRALAQEFLRDRPTLETVLRRRTAAGLLLESDRLEFMAAFESAATELARAEADASAAAAVLTSVTAARPAPQVQALAALSDKCLSFDLDSHPEVRALAERAAYFARRAPASVWRPLNSELRVGYSRTEELATGAPGHAAFASLTIDYAFGAADAQAQRHTQQREDAEQRWALRRQQLTLEVERLRARRTVIAQAMRLAQQARAAADLKHRERSLRAAKLAGDVIEQRQQSRYALYRAQLAEHAALREQWEWQIAATAFAESGCYEATPAAPTVTVNVAQDAVRGLFVWSPAQLLAALEPDAAPTVWQRLDALKVRRLLLSFDATELAQWRRDPARLAAAIGALHARGFRVEWLLGEPRWMLPDERATLLQLIDSFAALRFDAIHLDLEPNQLDPQGGDGREYLDDLLDTLRAVRARIASPIGLSIHPRYLSLAVEGKAFGEQLVALEIEPTLMIYVANPTRVAEIAAPLRERWPELPRRVAVSLEYELDAEHSVEHLSPQALEDHLATLERQLSDTAFRGLILQPSTQWLYATDARPRQP